MHKLIIILLFFFTCICSGFSQNSDSLHVSALREKLDQVTKTDSNFTNKVDISVSNIPVVELLKNIGKASSLNIIAKLPTNRMVTCNFKQIRIIDLLLFLCKEFSLNVEVMGNILTLSPYIEKVQEPEIDIAFNPVTRRVSFNFNNSKLQQVAIKFIQTCDCNIIVPQDMFNLNVSGYGHEMSINEAVYTLAAVNSLRAMKKGEGTWTLFKGDVAIFEGRNTFFSIDEVAVDSLGLITAKVTNGNIQNMIQEIARKLKLNYFLADNLSQTTNIFVESIELDEFLRVLFTRTNFTWKCENGIYIFGVMKPDEKLTSTKVFSLKYRTVDKIKELIPEELKLNMEIITYPDLNSLIISGEQRKVLQIANFLKDIDKSVPLISIDVIIVDASKEYTQDMGISMGLGKEPAVTAGSLSPGVDLTLGASSVNRIIDSFNGFGPLNLGKVTPNFYANLQMMEQNGYIDLRSTPRLATLNGNKATLKSGATQYYKEVQMNIIGTQNPLESKSYQWKSTEANFKLEITPFVSLDSCITLTIDLTQSEFTELNTKTEDAPPGTTTRSFNSIIKVHNEDMVLLGGIEKTLTRRTSKGLPLISRAPILRWLFGTTNKNKSDQKLNVFIKPTIIQ